MPIPEVDKIWMNGELVDWHDAQVHVLTHALHYGSGVFEGIRAYKTERGAAVFRLTDHLERLRRSAKLYYMDVPYTATSSLEATKELIARQRARALLHPADRLPRLRRDGPVPARRARSTASSRSGRGAPTWATRASSTACASRSRRIKSLDHNA